MKGVYCDNDVCVLLKVNDILLDFNIFKTSGDVVVSICVAYRAGTSPQPACVSAKIRFVLLLYLQLK